MEDNKRKHARTSKLVFEIALLVCNTCKILSYLSKLQNVTDLVFFFFFSFIRKNKIYIKLFCEKSLHNLKVLKRG